MSVKLNGDISQNGVGYAKTTTSNNMEQNLKYLRVQRDAVQDPSMQAEWARKRLVWVPHEKEGFVAGSILEDHGDDVVVEILETNKQIRLSKDDYQKMNPPKFDKVEDMAELTCLNEASVLHNLKERYYSDLIYTYSGLFCVVVNPYKRLPIYSDLLIDTYKGRKRNLMPPHIFAIADEAYRSMLSEHEDQSILCTGESGAGKTENTKKVIQYLAYVAGAARHSKGETLIKGELEQQLLQANPILEAFGNSKTVKNDNSSRFGKFIRINFDMSGLISGGNIEFYLLEKSRTCRQAVDERSFHVFYQLLKGATFQERENFLLLECDEYRYLNNGYISLPNVDDSAEYQSTVKSMQIMGFQREEIESIFRVVSAVLMFGNIEFIQEKKSDQALFADDSIAQKVCHLLGIPLQDFNKALLRPKIKVGREFVHKAQTKEQAEFSVEAISKACYERMFKWLVQRINKSLDRTRRQGASFIGILDIAGFEIFQLNSFEQLCINYTNEKLQQLFNNTMFVLEQEEYQREGIDWTFIDFGLDLQPTIDLIEKPMGVLALLDEECLFPKATDKSLVSKLTHNHDKHPKFLIPEMRAKSDFAIIHYAGRVDYSADQWLMKNMDPLNENVVNLMQVSNDAFVAGIWKDAEFAGMSATEANETAFGARTRKGMFRTVSQVYKEQLAKLMATLRNTVPHFVRCIIPNHEKKPGKITPLLVLEQLRCNGVLEGIRICRQGFPNRIPFQDFRHRYEILTPNVIPKGFMDGKEAVRKIIEALEVDPNIYRIGQSKIFFRAGVLAQLEEDRDIKLTDLIVRFQAICRGYLAKKRYQMRIQQSNAIRVLQRNGLAWLKLRNWQWWRLFTKVKPLLQVTNKEAEISAKNEELKSIQEKLEKVSNENEEMLNRQAQLLSERQALQSQIQQEVDEKAEIEESYLMIKNRHEELRQAYDDLNSRCEEDEQKVQSLAIEKKKLEETIRDLEEQLEEEEQARQKIQIDKNNVDSKWKLTEEQLAELRDSYEKLAREKKTVDDKLNQISFKYNEEEDKVKSIYKQKSKLEAQVQDIEQELTKEREHRMDIDKVKRRLEHELMEHKELVEEKRRKLDELNQHLIKREEDIARILTKSDEDSANISALQKQIRDLELQIEELKDDLETEKDARAKADRARRDLAEELETLKTEFIEASDKSAVSQEIQKRKDEELQFLQKQLEQQNQLSKEKHDEMKQHHQEQIELLRDQLDQLSKLRSQMEKAKINLENQNQALQEDLESLVHQKQESEKKRKNVENINCDLQTKYNEMEASKNSLILEHEKLKQEYDLLSKQRESDETSASLMERKIANLELQIKEMNDNLNDETKQKLASQTRVRQLEEELFNAGEREEEFQQFKLQNDREINNLRQQLAEYKKKAEEVSIQQLEDLKKKAQRDLENAQKATADAEAARDRSERSKKKVQEELEDVTIELECVRSNLREIEKKQRKFDQQLNEERANYQNALNEKDMLAHECREKETKILNLTQTVENIRNELEDSERVKKQLQLELDDLISSKDDFGKNVHELEKAKRQLEGELLNYKIQVEELDNMVQDHDDARLRWEVNIQGMKTEYERNLAAKEQDAEEKRRHLQRTIREMEEELETERRNKLNGTNQRKKLEAQLIEMEHQLEGSNKLKEDYAKQIKKLQQMLREASQELEDARQSREEMNAALKEVERKLRTVESEHHGMSEQYTTLLASKRNLEAELAELEEFRNRGSNLSPEDKRKLEARISQLEEDLEEEQNNVEISQEKLRKTQMQLEQMTTDLSMERNHSQKIEADRQNLDRINRELKSKIGEIESSSQNRSRAQLATLEAKINFLEEQLASESNERAVVSRQLRRLEKRLAEASLQVEEERKASELAKEAAERANIKQRQIRRQMDEFEEELSREKTKSRALQRELDDVNEACETLKRDNNQLRASVVSRRTNLLNRPYSSSRSTLAPTKTNSSSDNLQNHDDAESIGTDGTF
uniref:Myosin motor domain-containing protein n=1 Tax=Parastrongyloides trichosuri TaxID=131310 RepID=A0A0N5A3F0_PARTI